MPYILKGDRNWIDAQGLRDFARFITEHRGILTGEDIGKLNYIIIRILLATEPSKYADYNALEGVLGEVSKELYRRRVAQLEDRKIQENGDVF